MKNPFTLTGLSPKSSQIQLGRRFVGATSVTGSEHLPSQNSLAVVKAVPTSFSPTTLVRVIVVDDHEWIREIAAQVVRQTLPLAEVVVRNDGLEALLAYQEGGADFVVTNHHMPRMDGMTLIQELHAHAPDLPIVMISVNPAAKADAEAAGANWFLAKEQIMERMPRLLLDHIKGGARPAED